MKNDNFPQNSSEKEVHCLYILQIFLMPGFREGSWTFSVVQHLICGKFVILFEVDEGNPVSHRYEVGKWRGILIPFSENSWYSALIRCQNSTVGSFLKVNCIVESEIISMSSLFSLALKSSEWVFYSLEYNY